MKTKIFLGAVVAAAAMVVAPLAADAASKPKSLRIAAGNPGTGWTIVATAISQAFAQRGVRANAELGAGLSNIVTIGSGKNETGFTMTAVLPLAYKGEKPFPAPINNITGIAGVMTNTTHVMVHADSGVKSFKDFKGKPFATQPVGNVTTYVFQTLLELNGLSEGDLDISRGGQNFGSNQMKDRKVVGFTATTSYPSPAFVEASTSIDVSFVPVDDATFEGLKKVNPGFSRDVIPANTYRGQTADVPSISTPAVMIIRKEFPEDQVYWITKNLVESLPEIRKAFAAVRNLTPERMIVMPAVEMHPGAARYYKEIGLIKATN